MSVDRARLDRTISTLRARLLAARTPAGHWEGRLASSALSTATACVALMLVERARETPHGDLAAAGLAWIAAHQNDDGGWGDTTRSASNLSTSLLCWGALSLGSERAPLPGTAIDRASQFLSTRMGSLEPGTIRRSVLEAYGADRTFSAPILTCLALTGRLGPGDAAWSRVPQLPFELAACPHRWWEWLRLPVVSYALPALVAIGQARHHHRPTRNLPLAIIRSNLRRKTAEIAAGMQPESGGYLEATPLTAFVVMSLVGSASADHPIVARGIRFLVQSAREDGSWPIDTNLATWVTTLSVSALHAAGGIESHDRQAVAAWLVGQQVQREHPFTHAKPGGWAWTDLSGGVPDADDTSGALVALRHLAGDAHRDAAALGIGWLLDLQNRDGGLPTFCRGWGALPFDRSAPDLTAHALEAWAAWSDAMPDSVRSRISAASALAVRYLAQCRNRDGSWVPLWFGNEHMPGQLNRVYGTARVVAALRAAKARGLRDVEGVCRDGVTWLLRAQNRDGGWGGGADPSSIEETGIALHALAGYDGTDANVSRGAEWLIGATHMGDDTPASPIGLYFARLWYYEELYPLIFALAGLSRVRGAR